MWRLLALATAAWAAPDLDVILYGATGCVGHFAAQHLAQQEHLKWAIAGRTEAHLQSLLQDLRAMPGLASEPEVIVAPLSNTSNFSWVKRAKAVATAAGPFSVHGGEYLVRACAESGVHYTDTSDEFYWQRWMVDRYDSAAQASGARVVLSTGFCDQVADLGAQLAIERLGPGAGEVSVDEWLETYSGGISAGVINTARHLLNVSYPKAWDKDPYVLAPAAPADLRVDSKVTGTGVVTFAGWEGLIVPNIFGPYDARLLRRTFAELGQKVHLRVGATPGVYVKWLALLARHPSAWPTLTKCPNDVLYRKGSWRTRVKASSSGGSAEVLLSGTGDPGYHFTAWGLAEAALCLAGRTQGCMAQGRRGGVLTTMAALNATVLRQRLESIGLLSVSVKGGSAGAAADAVSATVTV